MNLSAAFQKPAETLKYLRYSTQQHISLLPEGELKIYHRMVNGKDYISFIHCLPNGQRTHINKNLDLLQKLASKMYLEKELFLIEEIISLCNSAIINAEQLTVSSILNILPPEIRPFLKFDNGKNSIKTSKAISNKRLSDWKNESYIANPYNPDERKHRTSDGTFVKSKSELIIYEKLFQYKITFKYESPLTIGNTIYYPDFTIMLPNGVFIYWEHAGLIYQKDYRLRHKKKLEDYESIGIVPWKNLIVTYDDENGNLDIRIVESEIKNKLLT